MIVICEPQCRGFEHSEVNAAMIAVINHAFENEELLFFAEKDHLSHVRSLLVKQSIYITFKEIRIPPTLQSNYFRIFKEFEIVQNVFRFAKKSGATRVLFCSVTSPTLISIKIVIPFFKNIKTIVIPHSILGTITEFPRNPIKILFWFKFWISVFNVRNLIYLVLGSSIESELVNELPEMKDYIHSLDHPYFYMKNQRDLPSKIKNIKFGFLGVVTNFKGAEFFFKLAKEIKTTKTNSNAEFFLIGHVTDGSIKQLQHEYIKIPSPKVPLSQENYSSYLEIIDYAVFFYREENYRLIASGTLFDAFSYLKPVIALRNPFFEYYFNKMGDIGYLCDNYEEIKELVLNILNNKSKERYRVQQGNILKNRDYLSLNAKKIRKIWA